MKSSDPSTSPRLRRVLVTLVGVVVLGTVCWSGRGLLRHVTDTPSRPPQSPIEVRPVSATTQQPNRLPDNALDGGVDWINTRGPIHLQELRGKVVLLDFWTYCCINCHHILPDLERLEEKYPNELVVIGVHTAKFEAEKITDNIRKKVAEYRIRHPVVNDANQVLWSKFGVNAWPTLVLIDATGRYQGFVSGEGHYEVLDRAIGTLVEDHRKRGELNETPLYFEPEVDRPVDAPLLYPGKILADAEGGRLFISDTGHNRIVVTDLDGRHVTNIGNGETGRRDGSFEESSFHRPQGLCLVGTTLYIADTENHMIRAVDLEARRVTTIAGTGEQSYRREGGGPARTTGLNSPWDVLPDPRDPRRLYLAMAGPHQIWVLDLANDAVSVWAGSGREDIIDGTRGSAAFAQPSGLATDGDFLYVADSEVSGIRSVDLNGDRVTTVVGVGLFGFGDLDGKGDQVRLQHCLGLAYGGGRLYIADSYNNKIKVCQPVERAVQTYFGSGETGSTDDPPRFDEPGGLSLAGETLYIADTNNHAIRKADLKSRAVCTLALEGVTKPTPPLRAPTFPNAEVVELETVQVAPGDSFTLDVAIELPEGYKLNPDAPMPFLLEAADRPDALASAVEPTGGRVDPPAATFQVEVSLAQPAKAGESLTIRLSTSAFLCEATLCEIHSYVWNIPVTFAESGTRTVALTGPVAKVAGR